VTTTLEPSASTATASVGETKVALLGLPAIDIGPVYTTATASCANTSGSATIGFAKIGTTLVFSSLVPAKPNTTINVGLLKVVLNEQIPAAGAGRGLTVNAVHITSPANGSLLNLIVASATSGISICPP
jgi:hypothetical protein